MWKSLIAIAFAALVPAAWGAEDPGAGALLQQQLLRQQQQEALQLRMQQYQRIQSAPADAQQTRSLEQLQAEQRQRQEQLHYRQAIEPATAQPSDDEGTRRVKAQMERKKASQESQLQIRQSDQEPLQGFGKPDEPGAGVPVPRRKLKIPPDTAFGR